MFDLSKAYNTMRIGVVEKHLPRFVLRINEDEDWADCAIYKVNLGDLPTSCQLEVSKLKVAKIRRHIDPEAVNKFVDQGHPHLYVRSSCLTGKGLKKFIKSIFSLLFLVLNERKYALHSSS